MMHAVPLGSALQKAALFLAMVILDGAVESVAIHSAGADVQLGREAAIRYCQTCHLLPKPELLDKESWVNGALPHMAPWMGVARLNLASRSDGQRLAAAGIFPPAPLLS